MARSLKPISDEDLKAIVDSEIRGAMGEAASEIASERATALDYYHGKAVGPLAVDNDDRSKAIVTVTRDTVEWMMPQLMRLFTQTEELVTFEGADERAAKEATDAVNYVFWRKNPGFLILYSYIKDALLQKNGLITWYIDESETKEREEIDGLTDIALLQRAQNPELREVEREESKIEGINGIKLHRVVYERTKKRKRIKVEVLPPEEGLVSSDARSLDLQTNAPRFVGRYTQDKTASDLREMGFDETEIQDMMTGSDEPWHNLDQQHVSRYDKTDEQNISDDIAHESQRRIKLVEGYMHLDRDGDGYNELVRIWRAGNFCKSEPAEQIPISSITPNILTHKFHGESIADAVKDLQEQGSTVLRNVFDNMYQTNNVRPVANERVNVDSLLESRPGSPVWVDDELPIDGALGQFAPPPMWKEGLGFLEYMDSRRRERTGVGDETMGLDPAALANANTGVVLEAMEAARAKVELIGRIFAETGIKWCFRGIYEMARKNLDEPIIYRRKGHRTQAMPQNWPELEEDEIVANVGNSASNAQRKLFAMAQIGQLQERMVMGGGLGITVLPNQIYETAKVTAEALGQEGDKFFFNPIQRMQPGVQEAIQAMLPAPAPDPAAGLAQAQLKIEQDKRVTENRKLELQTMIQQHELQLKREDMAGRREIEQLRIRLQTLQAEAKNRTDIDKTIIQETSDATENAIKVLQTQLEQKQAAQDAMLEKYRAELASYTALEKQRMEIAQRGEESAQKAAERAEQTEGALQTTIAQLTERLDAMAAELQALKAG